MMKATIIYNPNAGATHEISVDKLLELLFEQGYVPSYEATHDEQDLDAILKNARGLVVSVGGDGTQRAVAKRLIGKDTALAIIPLGTANNIAHALDIQGSPQELIRGLKAAKKLAFDVGRVKSPFGEDYFLEAVGCGLFADILYDYDPEQGKSVLRALTTLKDVLLGYEPQFWSISLDGKALSDNYLGLEILNTKATGPRLKLAPDADPTDGLLDIVCVRPPAMAKLFDYLTTLISKPLNELDNIATFQGKKVEISWNGSPLHIDAELRPDPQTFRLEHNEANPTGRIVVDLLPGALKLFVPQIY